MSGAKTRELLQEQLRWQRLRRHKKGGTPREDPAPRDADQTDTETQWSIFVSIPAYRDPETPHTVLDCFAKAEFPDRVFAGVCQQKHTWEPDCLAQFPENSLWKSHVRVLTLEPHEAKGPVYARHLIERDLFRDELFVLLIDSHTLFAPSWDSECIRQLLQCPAEKPILTTYPLDFDRNTRLLPVDPLPCFLKHRDFHPRIGFHQQDPVRFRYLPPRPLPSLFWGAGFSFGPSKMLEEVPYDPNLEYVFLGEEISMAARLFTSGYDLFAPCSNLVFHVSSRSYRPVFWEQFYKKDGHLLVSEADRLERKDKEKRGNLRLHSLLRGQLEPDDPFGLGKCRTLEAFQEFTGLDFMSRVSSRHARLGLSPEASAEETWYKYGMKDL
jgi:hypothetical protein